MTIRTQLQKTLSFGRQRASQGNEPHGSGTDDDHEATNGAVAESYHRSKAYRHIRLLKNTQRLNSVGSNSSAASFEHTRIHPTTHALAVQAAEGKKASFRESLPQSLVEAAADELRDSVAPFQRKEIEFGSKLGSGEFSNVYEVKSFRLASDVAEMNDDETEQRNYMKENEKYQDTDNACYALKHIKEDYFKNHWDTESHVQAISDLTLEAELLASLIHPNIIKLRGIAGASGLIDGPSGYFLVIDRLFETLDQRLNKWNNDSGTKLQRSLSRIKSIKSIRCLDSKNNSKKMLDEKLTIGLQLSAAIAYLHQHSIIFRDLKPQNIGFDVRGDVKIFDFGLARIMPENGDPYTDKFDMSGAGSPRYMAPECLDKTPYNLKADVYTFALVMWEVLSGQIPYGFAKSVKRLISHVVNDHGRPPIDQAWPSTIRDMLESSFHFDMDERPEMKWCLDCIRDALISIRGSAVGLNDTMINIRRTDLSQLQDMEAICKASSRR